MENEVIDENIYLNDNFTFYDDNNSVISKNPDISCPNAYQEKDTLYYLNY